MVSCNTKYYKCFCFKFNYLIYSAEILIWFLFKFSDLIELDNRRGDFVTTELKKNKSIQIIE